MRDPGQFIEANANFILNLIRNNDKITIKELQALIERSGNKNKITEPMTRRSVVRLFKTGHIKKIGVHKHTLTAIKDEPYVYPKIIRTKKKIKTSEQTLRPINNRKKIPMAVYQENLKGKVELKANIILKMIRKHPLKTQKRLLSLLQVNNKEFRTLKPQMFRNYVTTLNEQGYIKRTGKRFSKYSITKNTPFTYVSVSIYNPKRQREI